MDRNKIINNRVVLLFIFTLVTVLIWVVLNSYHELVRRDRIEDVSQLLTPLDPSLEESVLDMIKNRREYSLGEVEDYLKPQPTPTATPVPTVEVDEEEITEDGTEAEPEPEEEPEDENE